MQSFGVLHEMGAVVAKALPAPDPPADNHGLSKMCLPECGQSNHTNICTSLK